MLIEIYTLMIVFAFSFFGFGLVIGSLDFVLTNAEFIIKRGLPAILMFISMILFVFCGLNSLNIQGEYCENYINSSITIGNTTTQTSSFSCHSERYSDTPLGGFFGIMVIISAIFAIYYSFGIKDGI